MDLGRSLTFAFDDTQWTDRIALGTVICLVPILNVAVAGYQVEVARRVVQGEARPLPDWDNLGRKWKEGIVLLVVSLIYYLPLYLLLCGPLALFVPVLFIPDEKRAVTAAGIVVLIWSLACGAGLFFSLVMGFFSLAVRLQYVLHGTLAACFNLSAILGTIRRHTGQYLLAWLGTVCAGLIYGGVVMGSSLVGIIPFVGWVIQVLLLGASVFWMELVTGHLVGQLGAIEQSA